MVNINKNPETYKPPYRIILMDAFDAYYYADIYEDRMSLFDKVEDLRIARALANALFVVKNYKWESLKAMNDVDGGWDVRVFDANSNCVHAAHKTFKKNWIGK